MWGAGASEVAAARRAFRAECQRARAAFQWHLEGFRAASPHQFWSFLKVRPPAPVPGVAAFREFFGRLFGTGTSSAEPPALAELLDAALLPAFSAEEVAAAL